MFCTNCGKELKPDASFCSCCGKPVSTHVGEDHPDPATEENNSTMVDSPAANKINADIDSFTADDAGAVGNSLTADDAITGSDSPSVNTNPVSTVQTDFVAEDQSTPVTPEIDEDRPDPAFEVNTSTESAHIPSGDIPSDVDESAFIPSGDIPLDAKSLHTLAPRPLILALVVLVLTVLILSITLIVIKVIPERKVNSSIASGDKCMANLEYDNAVTAYESALAIKPETEAAYLGISNAYIGLNDYDLALDTVKNGISVLGETEDLAAQKTQIEELISEREQEEAKEIKALEEQEAEGNKTLEGQEDEGNKTLEGQEAPEEGHTVADWTFDLYDILKYDVFGKNVDEWTREEFQTYLDDNGYSGFEAGSGDPHYAVSQGDSDPAFFAGGEISIQFGDGSLWAIRKSTFSPEIESLNFLLHYDFPPIHEITEDEFLERLPSEISRILSEENQLAYFTGGCCTMSPEETQIYSISTYDSETSFVPVRTYYFDTDNKHYRFSFNTDTGELIYIDETDHSLIEDESSSDDSVSATETPDDATVSTTDDAFGSQGNSESSKE